MSELVTGITPLIVIWCSLALLTIGLVVPIFLLYSSVRH